MISPFPINTINFFNLVTAVASLTLLKLIRSICTHHHHLAFTYTFCLQVQHHLLSFQCTIKPPVCSKFLCSVFNRIVNVIFLIFVVCTYKTMEWEHSIKLDLFIWFTWYLLFQLKWEIIWKYNFLVKPYIYSYFDKKSGMIKESNLNYQ